MRLTIEEMLLSMKEHFGEGYGVSLCIEKTLGTPSFHLYCKGEAFNPFDMAETQDEWIEHFFRHDDFPLHHKRYMWNR